MSTIERFEDLKVWQASREFCKLIHQFTLKEAFSKDFKLISQIKSSSGSVMDNIAEGYERDGNKEFGQFLSVSKGSCGESRSQLYRAMDNGYISKQEFDQAYMQALEINKMLSGFMSYLKESELKGKKFK
ncbi:four helix bundle protein [Gaoshiqia sp. Z1-71]|uniref:four helix bundle protein n=1 Tax=Gaoshiqia hydrogeniformans TaxID=3290090 RepID=UPI003BF7CACC